MAAVTQNSRPTNNVNGSLREVYYNISIATSGDTLSVPLRTIYDLSYNKTAAVTQAVPTAAAGGNTITFTTTGAVSNLLFKVTGV